MTVLKQQCREHGINRWPYRKVRKLDTMLHVLENTTPPEKLRPFALTNGETEVSCSEECSSHPCRLPHSLYYTSAGHAMLQRTDFLSPSVSLLLQRKRKIETVKDALTQLLHDPNSSAHLKLGKSRGVRPPTHRDSNSSSHVNVSATQPNIASSFTSPAATPHVPAEPAVCFPPLMHQSSGSLDTSVTPQAALACLLMARGQGIPPSAALAVPPVSVPVVPSAPIPMTSGLHPEQLMALRLAAHRQMIADHVAIRAQVPNLSKSAHPPSPHSAEAYHAQIRRLQFVESTSRDVSANDTQIGAPSPHQPAASDRLYAKFPVKPVSLSSDAEASPADEGSSRLPELDLLSRIGSEGGCGKECLSPAAGAAAALSLGLDSRSNQEGQILLMRQQEGGVNTFLHSTPPSGETSSEDEGKNEKPLAPVLAFGLSLPSSPASTSSSHGDAESQVAGKRRRLSDSPAAAPSVAPLTPPAGGSVHSRYSAVTAAAAAAAGLGLSLAVQF